MKQLTIRGFDEELERRIRHLARAERISLNRAVLHLLRKGAGLVESPGGLDVVGSALDDHIGSWTDEEAAQVLEAIQDFEEVDESLWQ